MSKTQKFILLTTITFAALIAVGSWSPHNADPGGPAGIGNGTVLKATQVATNNPLGITKVPVSAAGMQALATNIAHVAISVNFTWLLLTGFLVLFMQVGFAFLVTGLTRAKNAGHMMMMNLVSFVVALMAYYVVGFAFQFGGVGAISNLGGTSPLSSSIGHGNAMFLGLHGFFLQSGSAYDVGVLAFFLFQVVFMETAGYIIIGAIAERISFAGFLFAEVAIGAIVYPVYGGWVWGGGWLAHIGQSMHLGHGAVDFAGSGVVHATGGWAALALAMLLGPRIGKFRSDGTVRAFPGHNLGYVVIGTLVLTFGWMGFNPGSTFGATDLRIGIVAVNTLLAASAGAIAAMAWTNWKWGKPDISMTCNGMLAGLVAITCPCAFVAPWAATMIGIIAGMLVCWSVGFYDKLKIDDPCGAISVHGMCGAWGLLSLGLFADGTYGVGWNGVQATASHGVQGIFYAGAGWGQLGAQVVDIVVGFIWAWGSMYILFSIAKRFMKTRVAPEVEIAGLDEAEFGQFCYPDFQLVTETDLGLDHEFGAAGVGSQTTSSTTTV